ncbi:MAG: hypothetical protein JXR91_14670 [Deltaproteobacteria bacterium]|nr:hypothetical protein [Deltaproteobacteria bacterium]
MEKFSISQNVQYSIDDCNCRYLMGWAIHPSGIKKISISVEGHYVGDAVIGLERGDVGNNYPDISDSDKSGFAFIFNREFMDKPLCRIQVEIIPNDGRVFSLSQDDVPTLVMTLKDAIFSSGSETPVLAPVPWGVVKALRILLPDVYNTDNWSPELIRQAITDTGILYKSHAAIAPVQQWVIFLRTMWRRYNEFRQQWEHFNAFRVPDDKDGMGIGTIPEEMISIANQLYVLKSYGIPGEFAEFGCYKGFSSCCLSLACNELDIPMHVFDSFAGLPDTGSTFYKEGDFCGSFEEVSSNIATFGHISSVTFHKGFFSETVKDFKTPLMCLWMDVDLYTSALDVTPVFNLLDKRSCIFTHEFLGDSLNEDGTFRFETSEVLPAIADKFNKDGRNIAGEHMNVATGAIWEPGQGIPAASIDILEPLFS